MALSEAEIRNLTLKAIKDLGDQATPEKIKSYVKQSIMSDEITLPNSDQDSKTSGKVILTSFGMNHPGIVAGVTNALSAANIDINDLSQKIMGDFYTMIIILDISNSSKDLSEIQNDLNIVADELKIKIYLQHEDLFRYMHRV